MLMFNQVQATRQIVKFIVYYYIYVYEVVQEKNNNSRSLKFYKGFMTRNEVKIKKKQVE